jgi:hypothetical protein
MLARNNIPQAATYTTRDFRRGHAQDLVDAGWPFVALHFHGLASCSLGARIGEILRAGEWRSPAFMAYLDVTALEAAAVVEAALGEEDSELGSDSDSD